METLADIKWSAPSTYAATGVHHGYRTAPAAIDDLDLYNVGQDVVKAWWGMLEPGGFIVPHVDASPWFVRWHYPTEPAGYVWERPHDDQPSWKMHSPTKPFEIHHNQPHAVWNPTSSRRVHLIVETDERLPGDSGLVLCPMIAEVQELIDALL